MRGLIERWRRAPTLSPVGLLTWAALIVLAFAILHAAGLRDATSILSGTVAGGVGATFGGVVYALVHFAAVLIAPILALGAAILAIWMWARRR